MDSTRAVLDLNWSRSGKGWEGQCSLDISPSRTSQSTNHNTFIDQRDIDEYITSSFAMVGMPCPWVNPTH